MNHLTMRAIIHVIVPFGVFWNFFDIRILNPLEYEWLLVGDWGQHFIGWHLFRHDEWHFPLSETKLANYPNGFSILFSDSNPLVSIILKLISSFLPNTFQFVGIWFLLCVILNFHAIVILLQLYIRDKNFIYLLATLFIMYPPFFMRFGHENLVAHFFWIYGLYFYMADVSLRRATIWFAVLASLAAGVHPYFVPVIVALSVARAIAATEDWRTGLRSMGFVVIFHIVPLIGIMFLIGYFGTYIESKGGYGQYSMNLNALWNSDDRSLFFEALPMQPKQYEGFQYLGIGWMLVLLYSIVYVHILSIKKRDAVLILMCLIVFIFSLSNKIYWNDTLLVEYTLPHWMRQISNTFRASGRFFWLVAFVIFIFGARRLVRGSTVFAYLVVAVGILLQMLDLTPLKEEVRAYATTEKDYRRPQIRRLMDVVGDKPKFIYILQEPEKWVLNLGLEAAIRQVPIANMHLARTHSTQQSWLAAQRERFYQGQLVKNAIYISVNQPLQNKAVRSFRVANRCVNVATGSTLSAVLNEVYPDITNEVSLYEVLHGCGQGCALGLAIHEEGTKHLSSRAKRFLGDLGSEIANLGYLQSYAALIKDKKLVAEDYGNDRVELRGQYASHDIKIVSGGQMAGAVASLVVNGRQYAPNRRGFNVVRLSVDGSVKSYWFDTYAGECASTPHPGR